MTKIIFSNSVFGADNWNPRFWMNADLDNNKRLFSSDEKIISYFFYKLKTDFGITDSLKQKIIASFEQKYIEETISFLFSEEEISFCEKELFNKTVNSLEKLKKEENIDSIIKEYLPFLIKKKTNFSFSIHEKEQIRLIIPSILKECKELKDKEIKKLKERLDFLEDL